MTKIVVKCAQNLKWRKSLCHRKMLKVLKTVLKALRKCAKVLKIVLRYGNANESAERQIQALQVRSPNRDAPSAVGCFCARGRRRRQPAPEAIVAAC